MDIKDQIGNRITKSRKALGITIKELSARIGALSAARISNWEQGTRSPGPLEAKLLADQLRVSASYLLCLTDNPEGELLLSNGVGMRFVPLLTMKEASHANFSLDQALLLCDGREKAVVVDNLNQSKTNARLFALRIEDTSMQPTLNVGDLVIVDADRIPNPGDLVLAYFSVKNQTILRRYGEATDCLFQLLASNDLWAIITIKNEEDVILCGVVSEYRRYL